MADANGIGRRFGSTLGQGTTDQVLTGYTSSGNNKRSYSVWYYRNGLGGGNNGRIFQKGATGTGSETLFIEQASIALWFVRRNSGGTITAQHSLGNSFTTGNQTGAWYNLVITHDQGGGAAAPTLYLNGASATASLRSAAAGTSADNTSAFTIGNGISGTRNWDGSIAWFTIWDNILLTAMEAKMIYNGYPSWRVRPGSIVCCVPMLGLSPEKDLKAANGTATVTGTYIAVGPPVTKIFRPAGYRHTTTGG